MPARDWPDGPKGGSNNRLYNASQRHDQRGQMKSKTPKLAAAIAALSCCCPLHLFAAGQYASGGLAPTSVPAMTMPAMTPNLNLRPALESGVSFLDAGTLGTAK